MSSKPIFIAGESFDSISSACQHFGIPMNDVVQKLESGWPLAQAFALSSAPPSKLKSGTPVTFDGITYVSFKQLCDVYNAPYIESKKRYKRGAPIEQALGIVPYVDTRKQVTVWGENFASFKAACEFHRVNYKTSQKRLYDGKTPEEAIQPPQKQFTVNNITFKNKTAACRHYNICIMKVNKRLNRGWSVEQAFDLLPPPSQKRRRKMPVTVAGKTYTSLSAACKHLGISRDTVSERLERGVSIEDAFAVSDKSFTVNGKTFKDKKTALEHYNVKRDFVNSRLKNGCSVEQAFGLEPSPARKGKAVTVSGKTYVSLKQACIEHNIEYEKVRNRINAGTPIEQALEIEPYIKNDQNITVNRKVFPSVKDACSFYSVNYGTVWKRLNKGIPLEEAIKDKQTTQFTVNGVTFKNRLSACKHFNINISTVNTRLKSGWSVEQAFGLIPPPTTRKKRQRSPVTIDGQTFENKASAYKHYNTNASTVNRRLRSGWSVEQAFGLIPPPNTQKNKRAFTVNGITFKSKHSACKHYNTNTSTVNKRLKKGWSVDQAFGLILPPKPSTKGGRHPVTIDSQTFENKASACRHYNISESAVSRRLKKGWSVEQAFGLEPSPARKGKAVTVSGKTYASLKQACTEHNIEYDKVRERIKAGTPIEQALEIKPYTKNDKNINVSGKVFPSVKAACSFYGVNYGNVLYRLKKGLPLEEAIKDKPNNPFTVNGVTFKNKRSACKHYNISDATVYQRLKRDWSVEQAFGLIPPPNLPKQTKM